MLQRTICALAVLFAFLTTASARADLTSFVHDVGPDYKWEITSTSDAGGVKTYELKMVSQVWHGITWTHRVLVCRPDQPKYPDFCALFNTGGEGGENKLLATMAAARTGATFAVIEDEPNQPLFGGLTEDALVVYTWQKYLESGDETWLLHWAMTRAIMRAIDTVQALAKQENQPAVTRFLVCGASKRGWNSWLAGASQDPRIVAIAPMVIDTLNLPAQIPHQLAAYGKMSEQVADYSRTGMMQKLNTPEGKKLIALEDPYSYRDVLTLPKLLILGTNDRYWAQDALNIYWGDLKGPKWVSYTPNSGHGLEDRGHVLSTLTAYIEANASGTRLARQRWEFTPIANGVNLKITSRAHIKSARLFHVTAATQDFRDSHWTSEPMTETDGAWSGHYNTPSTGYAATFGEATYELNGHEYTLSTQMYILGAK
jgi:PhoPQ-activated pathogenicity-related protein